MSVFLTANSSENVQQNVCQSVSKKFREDLNRNGSMLNFDLISLAEQLLLEFILFGAD